MSTQRRVPEEMAADRGVSCQYGSCGKNALKAEREVDSSDSPMKRKCGEFKLSAFPLPNTGIPVSDSMGPMGQLAEECHDGLTFW